MTDQISVLIADDNVEYSDLLKEYMDQCDDIVVKGIALDGLETIDRIKELQPDVVILDIIMPNLDGIGVLEKMAEMELARRPMFVVLSAIGQDVFVHRAISLGAEYYIVKPFDVEILVSRIRQVYREKHMLFPFAGSYDRDRALAKGAAPGEQTGINLEALVTGLMRNAGIPPHVCGYQYLREAIMMYVNGDPAFGSITKTIYPAIALKYNITARKVERAIRNAISSAWWKGGISGNDAESEIFINFGPKKPTNSQFISTLADKARIGMGVGLSKIKA